MFPAQNWRFENKERIQQNIQHFRLQVAEQSLVRRVDFEAVYVMCALSLLYSLLV